MLPLGQMHLRANLAGCPSQGGVDLLECDRSLKRGREISARERLSRPRGLQMVGNFALVGLSRIRRKHILDAPPVRARHRQLTAGVALVDLRSGQQRGCLEFVRGGSEVFDVVFLPGVRRPDLVGDLREKR